MKSNKLLVIVLFFSILYLDLNATNVDSLKQILLKTREFEKRVPLLYDIGKEVQKSKSDSALLYFRQIIEEGENSGYLDSQIYKEETKEYILKSLIISGKILRKQGKFDNALKYFRQALTLSIKINKNELKGEVYDGMGVVFRQQGDFKQALNYELKALNIAKILKDSTWIASLYNNLGVVYMGMENYKKALYAFTQTLEIIEKTKAYEPNVEFLNIGNIYKLQKDYKKALQYVNKALELSLKSGDKQRIAECYYILGDIFLIKGKNNLAKQYFFDAISIFDSLNYNYGKDECYSKIGKSLKNENNFVESLNYYNKALVIAREQNDKETESIVLYNIADLYFKMNNISKTEEYANLSLDISQKMNYIKNLKLNYELLSEYYEKKGDYKQALYFFKKYNVIQDSIFSKEKYRVILETEAKYLDLKKDMDFTLLQKSEDVLKEKIEKNKIITIAFSIISILLFLLLLLGYFYYKQKEKEIKDKVEKEKSGLRLEYDKKLMELRLAAIKNQLNPHFIFNILNSIGSIILKEDKQVAYDLFTHFTSLIRHTIESSEKISIPLKEEMNQIEKYLFLQKFRFKGKFDYSIIIDDNVDLNILVPRMCAEIFVENAIKHGLKNKDKGGMITIKIKRKDNETIIEICDNGIGRKKASEIVNFGTGKGINIAKEMFDLYKKLHKNEVRFEIIDLFDENNKAIGTKIIEHIVITN